MLTTGLNEESLPSMQLFRRGDRMFMVVPPDAAQGQQVLVFDAAGHLVQRTMVQGTGVSIDIAGLDAGMYVVKVQDSTLPAVRFVKE
ncbi:MAG: T9SS type A sorting domain-containing protein [Flavobacteriales bacterium]|nr:T9SS type A sorting domain-containing protein [Flavobacteriales bacterium]